MAYIDHQIIFQIIIRRLEEESPKKKKKKKKRESVEEFDDADDCNFMFVCNRWFAKGEDDGQIVRELVPTDASGRRSRENSLAGIENVNYTFVFQPPPF